jgi:hypothetical protein
MCYLLALIVFASLRTPAEPAPSPSPLPTPHVALTVKGSNVFIDQATGGPGTTPPEASEFAHGSPISPMSPYDWLSSAPVIPGVAGIAQYEITGTYHSSGFDAAATIGLGGLTGSTTNALYWGEPLIPNLNAHGLSRVVPYAILFPAHAGADDATVGSASLINAFASGDDGRWKIQGGYFELTQTDRFVFAPPAMTSVLPSLGPQTAESIGPGLPSLDTWQPASTTLPLLGADAVLHQGDATLEATDALLPSPAGTNLRMTMGSLVLDRGDAGRFSFQVGHFWTTGGPISSTTFFGNGRQIYESVQGRLFTSNLESQTQTIAGARAFFHPFKNWDAIAELGRAWYDAGLVAYPGTSRFGNYEHFSIAHRWANDSATLEYHRFDPTYATLIAPYGIPENVWSIAWSWPGVWLKSNYQLVDNGVAGANRAGFRLRYDHPGKNVEFHAAYGDWRQLAPETIANASQVGFVDGFFLLQKSAFGTIGRDREAAAYLAWHLPQDDFAFDAVEDYLSRPAAAGQPLDVVAMRYPQAVLSWTHHFNKKLLAAGGYGRFAASGTWAVAPVDGIYGVGFVGVQFATGPKTAFLIQGRRYALVGLPSIPNGPPPEMRGTSLVVDQRIGL